MSKANKFQLNFLFFGLIFPIILYVWGSIESPEEIQAAGGIKNFVWGLGGFTMGMYMINAVLLGFQATFSRKFREKILRKLSGFQESDEREEIITAQSTRSVYLLNLGLYLLVFILSSLSIHVTRFTQQEVPDGKHGNLTLGFSFKAFDSWNSNKANDKVEEVNSESLTPEKTIYNYDFPLSKQGIVLLFIVWHLVTLRMFTRREL